MFDQQGGSLFGGHGSVGSGRDTFFCSAPKTEVDDFVFAHTRNLDWGGHPEISEVDKRRN